MTKPLSVGRMFISRGRNYSRVVLWVLRNSFRGHLLKLSGIYLFGVLYIAGQGAAIFVLYWYAQQMQTDGGLTLPALGLDWRARSDTGLLWTVVIVSTLAFMASATSMFLMRHMVMQLLSHYIRRGFEAVPWIAARLPDPRAPVASQLALNYSVTVLVSGCRYGAITALMFCNAVPPLIGALAAMWFLIWIDPPLTLTMFILSVLCAVLLYPVTQRAIRRANRAQKATQQYREEVRRLYGPRSPNRPFGQLASAATAVSTIALAKRKTTNEISFAIQIGVTVVLAVAVFYLASQLVGGREDWPIFAAYIVALRLALSGGAGGVRAFASVSRFYPEIARYFHFMRSAGEIDSKALGEVKPGTPILLGDLQNGNPVVVGTGQRLALVTADSVQELQFALLSARSLDDGLSLRAAPCYLTNAGFDPPADTTLILVESDELAEFERAALDREQLNLFFNAEGSEKTGRALLRSGLEDKVLMIIYRKPTDINRYRETHLLTIDEGAMMQFLPLSKPEAVGIIDTLFQTIKERKARTKEEEEEEEDEE